MFEGRKIPAMWWCGREGCWLRLANGDTAGEGNLYVAVPAPLSLEEHYLYMRSRTGRSYYCGVDGGPAGVT